MLLGTSCGTHWKLDGNCLGIIWEHIGSIQKPIPPQNSKEKKLGLHECYQEHENYKEGWQNKSFKFKSKIWNKRSKTKTQRLKAKTQNVQDQNTNMFLLW